MLYQRPRSPSSPARLSSTPATLARRLYGLREAECPGRLTAVQRSTNLVIPSPDHPPKTVMPCFWLRLLCAVGHVRHPASRFASLRQEIALADRVLGTSQATPDPTECSKLAESGQGKNRRSSPC